MAKRAREIANALCPPDQQKFGLEVVNGEASNADQALAAINEVVAALRTVGFLGDGKTVWLKDAQFLDAGVVGKVKGVKEGVERLTALIAGGVGEGNSLIISAEKVFRGSSFYKTCSSKGNVYELSVASSAKEKSQNSIQFAKDQLKSQQVQMTDDALRAFLNRCGSDKRQTAQEVQKLATYYDGVAPLDVEAVTILTSASVESEYWELADAVGKRDAKSALSVLRNQLELGGSPIGMVVGIERKISQLLVIRECLRLKAITQDSRSASWRSDPKIDPLIDRIIVDKRQDPRKMHPFRLLMLCKDAMNFSRAELKRGLRQAIETHEKLVSAMLPESSMLELLILRLTRREKQSSKV